MNKHQRNWIKALRSGDYAQASGYFKVVYDDPDFPELTDTVCGYCCLGVYLETAQDLPNWEWETGCDYVYLEDEEGNPRQSVQINGYGLFELESLDELPEADLLLLGLTTNDTNSLVTLNDSCHLSFEQIADVLEHVFKDGSIGVDDAALELGYATQEGAATAGDRKLLSPLRPLT